jgi:Flp pilus assembly protein TadD
MEENTPKGEALSVVLTFPQFIKELLTNYKHFLETHFMADKPPFLFVMMWLLGMCSIIYRIEMNYLSTQTYELDSWILVWAFILIGGVILGYLGYWIGGTLYHLRVWVSGGSTNFKISRNLFLYTGLPIYMVAVFIAIVDTFAYGSGYFAERSNVLLDIILLGLCVLGIICAISLSYRGVCLLQKTKRVRSIIFFIVLPAIFYSPLYGGFVYKFQGATANAGNYNEQAIELMFTGQYETAEKLFNRALRKVTKDDKDFLIRIYGNLGQLYELRGQTHESMEFYEEALSLAEPESSPYYAMLGKVNILKRSPYEAIGNFEKALELNPHDFYTHSQLGLIFLGHVDSEIKDYERALIHNEEAYVLNKGSFPKQNLATNYYLLKRYSDALPLFESLNALTPQNALAKYCMGRIYYSNNQLDKAKIFLKEAITLDPSLPSADIEHIIKD